MAMQRIFLALCASLMVAGTAQAQAVDPMVEAARTRGDIGEQADGYLGIRVSSGSDLKARVDQVNIWRRQIYTDLAAKRGVNVADVGAATACELFQSRVAPNQYYRDPTGAWQQRAGSAPVKLPAYCGQ